MPTDPTKPAGPALARPGGQSAATLAETLPHALRFARTYRPAIKALPKMPSTGQRGYWEAVDRLGFAEETDRLDTLGFVRETFRTAREADAWFKQRKDRPDAPTTKSILTLG